MSDQYYVRRAGKISGPAKAKLLQQYAASGGGTPEAEKHTNETQVKTNRAE